MGGLLFLVLLGFAGHGFADEPEPVPAPVVARLTPAAETNLRTLIRNGEISARQVVDQLLHLPAPQQGTAFPASTVDHAAAHAFIRPRADSSFLDEALRLM